MMKQMKIQSLTLNPNIVPRLCKECRQGVPGLGVGGVYLQRGSEVILCMARHSQVLTTASKDIGDLRERELLAKNRVVQHIQKNG